jgi:peptidoglycan/xylan/chitin deacetylase (PgdA/CDA1 family)
VKQTLSPARADILEVREDRNGPYAKAKVHCSDGHTVIRWGLDAYTFRHLVAALRVNDISLDTKVKRAQRVAVEDIKRSANGTYECGLACMKSTGTTTHIRFACSELFISNHTWLLQVRSFRQLQDLAWVEPEQSMDARVSRRWLPRVRQMAVAFASFGMIGAIGAVGYLYSVHQQPQGVTAQIRPAILPAPNRAGQSGVTNAVESREGSQPENNEASPSKAGGPESLPSGSATVTQPVLSYAGDSGVPEVYEVAPGEVALTFDDGPSPYTDEIVHVLNEYHVHGSFFFVGNRIARWPEAVEDAVASGDLVGNHSKDHANLVHLSPAKQLAEVNDCTQAIERVDKTPVTLFRPPYGAFNKETLTVLKQDHFALALWNRDTKDWAAHSPEEIAHAVLTDHPSGGVFDLHDTQMTLQALPAIIQGLLNQHLKLVVLPSY